MDQLLHELTELYAPSGLEDELRRFVTDKLAPLCDEVSIDACGNVIGLIRPNNPPQPDLPPITILTHMDEISMVVKRIDSMGQVRVSRLGGIYPASIGQGPVDLIVGAERIPGILSFGSAHVTSESNTIWMTQHDGGGKALSWEDVYVFTGRTKDELIALGVHPGTRVVIHRCRRGVFRFHNYLSGYFLDNRAAIAVALLLAAKLQSERDRLKATLRLAMTTAEENGALGAAFLANKHPDGVFVAVDVGPAEAEYDIALNEAPIIVYGEGRTMLSESLCERLVATASRRGLQVQKAYFERFGSDASRTILYGAGAAAALIALPTLNTHGFEVINQNVLENAAELLLHFALSSAESSSEVFARPSAIS